MGGNRLTQAIASPPGTARTPVSTNVLISVGEGENLDNAMRRFKREVNKAGHLMDLRFHRFHETNQEKAKRKALNARRKNRIIRAKARKDDMKP